MNQALETPEIAIPDGCCRCEPLAGSPLVGLLRQLFDLIESLSSEQYVRKPVGVVESSIGGHVRHDLDHIEALLKGLRSGEINYDQRVRGTAVEHDRLAALDAILKLEQELLAFPWYQVAEQLTLTGLVTPDMPPLTAITSRDRELAFVVSHTIHHNALIRVMVKLLGAKVTDDFGYAPSTIASQRSRQCAR